MFESKLFFTALSLAALFYSGAASANGPVWVTKTIHITPQNVESFYINKAKKIIDASCINLKTGQRFKTCKKTLYRWHNTTDCKTQSEGGPPILSLRVPGVTLRNFHYIDGPDGLHVGPGASGAILQGIKGRACEDALTLNGPSDQNIVIENSSFTENPTEICTHGVNEGKSCQDKILQFNYANNVMLRNVRIEGRKSCLRLTYMPWTSLTLDGVSFKGCDYAVNASPKGGSRAFKKDEKVTIKIKNKTKFNSNKTDLKGKGKVLFKCDSKYKKLTVDLSNGAKQKGCQ